MAEKVLYLIKKVIGIILVICGILLSMFAIVGLFAVLTSEGPVNAGMIAVIIVGIIAGSFIGFGRNIVKRVDKSKALKLDEAERQAKIEEMHKEIQDLEEAQQLEAARIKKQEQELQARIQQMEFQRRLDEAQLQDQIERELSKRQYETQIDKIKQEEEIRIQVEKLRQQDEVKRRYEELKRREEQEEEARRITEVKKRQAEIDIANIDGMEGHEFEYYCANLLKKNGFIDVEVTRGSGDQGVDIIACKSGIKYAIQCKNYATRLGNTPVQEVSAGRLFYNCHVGVVMTNSTFTQSAHDLANSTNVLLWDRSALQQLMIDGYGK